MYRAGVVFEMPANESLPNHVVYKIRQNASYTTTTQAVRSLFWIPGPRNWDYSYYTFGFLWVQVHCTQWLNVRQSCMNFVVCSCDDSLNVFVIEISKWR